MVIGLGTYARITAKSYAKGVKALWFYVLLVVATAFFVNGLRHFVAGCGLKRISEDVSWPRWLRGCRLMLRIETWEAGMKRKDAAAIRGDLHLTYSTAWWVLTGLALAGLTWIHS